ncbi:MAG: type II toxin-antitoxin system Phd/YefM family antitoxin [Stellaceae bacterium]
MKEFSTRDAKDGIASIVKGARQGRRTVILSRGVPIAVIGPTADLNEEEASAEEISTTQIKTGRRSIAAAKARNTDRAGVYLTIRGERVASIRWIPPDDREEASGSDDSPTAHRLERLISDVEELVHLLQETRVAQKEVERRRQISEYVLGLLKHSKEVVERLPSDYVRDQLSEKLEQLQAAYDQRP